VAEIEFAGWTGDNMVRQAAFKGLRKDKLASEVTADKPSRTHVATLSAKTNGKTPSPRGAASRGGDNIVMGVPISNPDKAMWPDGGDGGSGGEGGSGGGDSDTNTNGGDGGDGGDASNGDGGTGGDGGHGTGPAGNGGNGGDGGDGSPDNGDSGGDGGDGGNAGVPNGAGGDGGDGGEGDTGGDGGDGGSGGNGGDGGDGGEGDGLISNDDGEDGQDGTDQIPPPAPDRLFEDSDIRFIYDQLIEWLLRLGVFAARGDVVEWYATAYPDLQYLVSGYRLIDPDDANSTAELFVDAGPDAYGEVDYVLHPQYMISVSRIRVDLLVKPNGGPNPRFEIDLMNWDGTVFKTVTLADGIAVAGQPGWLLVRMDAVRPMQYAPFGVELDTFVLRWRDVNMKDLKVRGIIPRADVNADGAVDVFDAQAVIGNAGTPSPDPDEGDINGDGTVDGEDLNEVIQGAIGGGG